MNHQVRALRVVGVALILPLAVTIAALVVTFLLATTAPSTVAVHWGASGTADGFGSPFTYPVLLAAVALPMTAVFGGIAVVATHRGPVTAMIKVLGVIGLWVSVGLSVALGGLLLAQTGASGSASIAPLPIGFGCALVIAVAGWFALPKIEQRTAEPGATITPVALAASERAVWFRRASASGAVLWAVVGLTILLAAVSVVTVVSSRGSAWWVPFIPIVILLVLLSNLTWTVRVDARGVRIRSVVGIPRFTIPLSDIRSADVTDVQPLAGYGGWGLRFGFNGRIGIILRSGSALEILRNSGMSLVVTVDDAESGAALINGLIEQRSRVDS